MSSSPSHSLFSLCLIGPREREARESAVAQLTRAAYVAVIVLSLVPSRRSIATGLLIINFDLAPRIFLLR